MGAEPMSVVRVTWRPGSDARVTEEDVPSSSTAAMVSGMVGLCGHELLAIAVDGATVWESPDWVPPRAPGRPAKDGTRVQTRLTDVQRASILAAAEREGITTLSDAIAILATRAAEGSVEI